MPFDFSRLGPILFLFGLALIVFVIARRVRARGRMPGSNRSEPDLHYRRAHEPSPETLRQEVALHETARILAAELDTKMVALQVLTRQAAEERQRLEETIRQAERMSRAAEEVE